MYIIRTLHPTLKETVLDAWQDQLAVAAHDPWLASAMIQRTDEILPRFAYFYQKLRALPRRARRALQRKLTLTLAGVARMLALGHAPVQAATISVDGTTCTLIDAITAANTATGGCPASSGADSIELVPGEHQHPYQREQQYLWRHRAACHQQRDHH